MKYLILILFLTGCASLPSNYHPSDDIYIDWDAIYEN